jgi:hypothetical protein
MTGRRSTLRKVGKWAGLAVCLLVLGVGAASFARGRSCTLCDRPRVWVAVADGAIAVYWETWREPPEAAGRRMFYHPPVNPAVVGRILRFMFLGGDNQAGCATRLPTIDCDSAGGLVILPLWLPLVVATVLTATLRWRDRRRIPPGHCGQCGYNLTGNVSGVCPECGTAVAAGATRCNREDGGG